MKWVQWIHGATSAKSGRKLGVFSAQGLEIDPRESDRNYHYFGLLSSFDYDRVQVALGLLFVVPRSSGQKTASLDRVILGANKTQRLLSTWLTWLCALYGL